MMKLKRSFQEQAANWSAGELVNLGQHTALLKKSGSYMYSNVASSQYVCIRTTSDGKHGILLKGMGKIRRKHIMLVRGKSFCKDERDELFEGLHYYGYPFPTADELRDILDLVRTDTTIQQKLKASGMSFSPDATFWVSDTKSCFLGLKHCPQYYDPSTGRLATAKSLDEHHQRISVASF